MLGSSYGTPIRLTSVVGQMIPMVDFWVTWMYHGVTWKYDVVVIKRKGNWTVFCMGMLVQCIVIDFGYPGCMISHSKN